MLPYGLLNGSIGYKKAAQMVKLMLEYSSLQPAQNPLMPVPIERLGRKVDTGGPADYQLNPWEAQAALQALVLALAVHDPGVDELVKRAIFLDPHHDDPHGLAAGLPAGFSW